MNRRLYERIVDLINSAPSSLYASQSLPVSRQQIFEYVRDNLTCASPPQPPLTFDTFASIYGNIKRRQMFRSSLCSSSTLPMSASVTWRKLRDSSVQLCHKYKEYEEECGNNNHIILRMSSELGGVSPVLMARVLLDGFIRLDCLPVDTDSLDALNKDKLSVGSLLKETHLIRNGRLAGEIAECCALDDDHGPCIDLVKNLVGVEYEMRLERELVASGLSFVREGELRSLGFDKTPDFKLDVPVYLPHTGACISWIDSKATFGDEQSHAEYYDTQFKFYLNRFGSGLVIYWFGYVSDIDKCVTTAATTTSSNTEQQHRGASISICDRFPVDQFAVLDIHLLLENASI